MGKYFIEFELPDNDVVLNEAEHSYVSWGIWGFSGMTFPRKFVRCKDCDNRHTDDCPMYHEEWYEIDEGDGYVDNDFTVHDYSQDDGFCSWAKMKGGAE